MSGLSDILNRLTNDQMNFNLMDATWPSDTNEPHHRGIIFFFITKS